MRSKVMLGVVLCGALSLLSAVACADVGSRPRGFRAMKVAKMPFMVRKRVDGLTVGGDLGAVVYAARGKVRGRAVFLTDIHYDVIGAAQRFAFEGNGRSVRLHTPVSP